MAFLINLRFEEIKICLKGFFSHLNNKTYIILDYCIFKAIAILDYTPIWLFGLSFV